jgi:hypothetical protein
MPYAVILTELSENSSTSTETSPVIPKTPVATSSPRSLRILIQEARPVAAMNIAEKGDRGLSEAHTQFVEIIEEEKQRRRMFEANLYTVKGAVQKWLAHEPQKSDDDSDEVVVVSAGLIDRKRRCEPQQDAEFCAIQKSRRVQRQHVVVGASWSSD